MLMDSFEREHCYRLCITDAEFAVSRLQKVSRSLDTYLTKYKSSELVSELLMVENCIDHLEWFLRDLLPEASRDRGESR